MSVEIKTRTKLLAAMGIMVVATAGVTLAAFTDSGNVETTFTAGTLDLKFDDEQDGNPDNYVIDFSSGFDQLAPGDTVTYDLVVYNSGSIDAVVSLTAPLVTNSAGTPLPALETFLTLVITDSESGNVLFDGSLTSAAFTGLDIGSSGTANGTTLHFEVTLASAAPVGVAGQSINVVFPFEATQS